MRVKNFKRFLGDQRFQFEESANCLDEDSQMIGRIATDVAAKSVGKGRLSGFLKRAVNPNNMGPVLRSRGLLQIADYRQDAANVLVLAEQMQYPHTQDDTTRYLTRAVRDRRQANVGSLAKTTVSS